jgi:tetratricopeptide (TPR) repeat protein
MARHSVTTWKFVPISNSSFKRSGRVGQVFLALNRLDDAKAMFEQALTRKLDSGYVRSEMYCLAFLRGDSAKMEQQVAWAAGKPGDEDVLLSAQSDTEAYYGRLMKARDFSRRAVDSAVRADSKETAALWQVNAALREAEFGNATAAKQDVTAALTLAPGRDVKVLAALASARVGDTARAKVIVDELKKSNPSNTVLKVFWGCPLSMRPSNSPAAIQPKLSYFWKPLLPMNSASRHPHNN